MKEAVHDTPYQEFAHLEADMTRLPDVSSILQFHHMLEAHGLGQQIFAIVNAKLIDRGLIRKTGTVVDATLLSPPISTKNDKPGRASQDLLSELGQEDLPAACSVCTVELMDGAQTNFAEFSGQLTSQRLAKLADL